MPLSFRYESFYTTLFLINRLPILILNNISLFEKQYGRKPNYQFLKTFGCSCFPLLRPYSKHKFNFYTQKCLIIGYIPIHKGCKCLDPIGRLYIARHVQFNESEFLFLKFFPSHKSDHSASTIHQPYCPFTVISHNPIFQDFSSIYPSVHTHVSGAGSDIYIYTLANTFHFILSYYIICPNTPL